MEAVPGEGLKHSSKARESWVPWHRHLVKASLPPSHRTARFCIGHSLLLPLSQTAAHRWPTSANHANLAPTDPELPRPITPRHPRPYKLLISTSDLILGLSLVTRWVIHPVFQNNTSVLCLSVGPDRQWLAEAQCLDETRQNKSSLHESRYQRNIAAGVPENLNPVAASRAVVPRRQSIGSALSACFM